MSDTAIITLLYLGGLIVLVGEIYLPSHGVLSVVGVGLLIAGIVKTFAYGATAGLIAISTCLIVLQVMVFLAMKFWHRTPFAKWVSPKNPVLTDADSAMPIAVLESYVGRIGRAVSPLRPVGICEFDGRRVPCIAELRQLEPGAIVAAVGVRCGQVIVAEHPHAAVA